MRKYDEDENAANHDNRSLTPRLKQFKNDEMGTTRKGCSHWCFRPHLKFHQFTAWGRINQRMKIESGPNELQLKSDHLLYLFRFPYRQSDKDKIEI